jgi:hypothetical protein
MVYCDAGNCTGRTLKLTEIEQRLRRIETKHSLMPDGSKV